MLALSMRTARASGCSRSRLTNSLRPTITPACGPPSSLSPEKQTRFAPAARLSRADGSPVPVSGTVLRLTDGRYTMTDGGPNGLELSMGPSAVIAIGGIRLLLRSQPSMEWDKAMYVSQGLPLEEFAANAMHADAVVLVGDGGQKGGDADVVALEQGL